jgi:hypothetical protein
VESLRPGNPAFTKVLQHKVLETYKKNDLRAALYPACEDSLDAYCNFPDHHRYTLQSKGQDLAAGSVQVATTRNIPPGMHTHKV